MKSKKFIMPANIDMLEYEKKLLAKGVKRIIGVDEAGRGPLAGPVVVAAVVMKMDNIISGVNDSKKLSEKKREEFYPMILERAIDYKVVVIDEKTIDEINILNATKKGMTEAINSIDGEYALIDAVKLASINKPSESLIKGDARSYSIACASIVAKVHRDELMKKLHEKYPEYAFDRHKGYGTKQHIEKIRAHGATEVHRKSFLKNIDFDEEK